MLLFRSGVLSLVYVNMMSALIEGFTEMQTPRMKAKAAIFEKVFEHEFEKFEETAKYSDEELVQCVRHEPGHEAE